MTTFPRTLLACLAAGLALIAAGCVAAQGLPDKPLRLIVANSPGSTHDLLSRLIGTEMRKYVDQPIVIENKPGAGQMIGYDYVARQAPADGTTMATVAIPTLSLAPVTLKSVPFDTLKDLVPVAGLVETRYVFVSPAKAPWKSFRELFAYAKANPGKLNYGSSSQVIRIMMEVLMQGTGTDIARIDYNGGGPILQAVFSGDVHASFLAESVIGQAGDRMQILASTGEQRRPPIMAVPTFAELGFPQLSGLRYTMSVRGGTPRPVVQKLYEVISRTLQDPELRTRLAAAQLAVWSKTPEEALKTVQSETQMYAEIARKLKIEPQ